MFSINNNNGADGAPNNDFPSGNLNSFLDEMNTPKQDMGVDESAGLDTLEPEPMPEDEPEPETLQAQMGATAARSMGRMVTAVVDSVIPETLAYVAHDKADDYRATPDEKDELTEALTEYMRLKGGDIPPGMMVFILIVTIYGTKVPRALEARKLNEGLKRIEARERELNAIIEENKVQARILEKQREQMELMRKQETKEEKE